LWIQAILQGKPRVLLTIATGTGKTVVAFQICWKLWSSRWNFVLHLWSLLPHETTLHIQKTSRASPRSVVVRLIAEQIAMTT
jgi:hypothetical protein